MLLLDGLNLKMCDNVWCYLWLLLICFCCICLQDCAGRCTILLRRNSWRC